MDYDQNHDCVEAKIYKAKCKQTPKGERELALRELGKRFGLAKDDCEHAYVLVINESQDNVDQVCQVCGHKIKDYFE